MSLLVAPFGAVVDNSIYDYFNNIQCDMIDAVYIPTLEHKKSPAVNVDTLLQYSKEVVLLYSNNVAKWAVARSNRVRIEQMIHHANFCREYRSREGNDNIAVKWRPTFDIPLKRSFALSDARKRRYKKVLLLDDDICITPQVIPRCSRLLDAGYSIVGFHVIDYPDVSTIDHIERIVNGQENIISMTGSCMFLNVNQVQGDFLNVYNEDLFFFMQQPHPNKVVSGGIACQRAYLPWSDLNRIQHEQFGDLIYDAIKTRFLGTGVGNIQWDKELLNRVSRIESIKGSSNDPAVIAALDAAVTSVKDIKVSDIEAFIRCCKFASWVTRYTNF